MNDKDRILILTLFVFTIILASRPYLIMGRDTIDLIGFGIISFLLVGLFISLWRIET